MTGDNACRADANSDAKPSQELQPKPKNEPSSSLESLLTAMEKQTNLLTALVTTLSATNQTLTALANSQALLASAVMEMVVENKPEEGAEYLADDPPARDHEQYLG